MALTVGGPLTPRRWGVHHYESGGAASPKNRVNGKWTNGKNAATCNKPLWVTEWGLESHIVGTTTQANEYAQGINDVKSGATNAEMLFLYKIEDTAGRTFGIVGPKPSFTPKPSYSSVDAAVVCDP